jgi:hypothetical protein
MLLEGRRKVKSEDSMVRADSSPAAGINLLAFSIKVVKRR